MFDKPGPARLALALGLSLAMIASLWWFNLQTSRRLATQAVSDAAGSEATAVIIEKRRDFWVSFLKFNNLWCGRVEPGGRRFAVLVRQPGRRSNSTRRGVLELVLEPSDALPTERQRRLREMCSALRD
jgi:hypothetical protein